MLFFTGVLLYMSFYESVFIVRQDISSADVDKLVGDFSSIIKAHHGEVVKTEYWGIRALAYQINNNKKGHYVFLGINAENAALKEMERKMKLNENVIRFSTVRVDHISDQPSPILRVQHNDGENVIDVTT